MAPPAIQDEDSEGRIANGIDPISLFQQVAKYRLKIPRGFTAKSQPPKFPVS